MTDYQRAKQTVMIIIHSQQLVNWLTHARDLNTVSREFKYRSGIILTALKNFLLSIEKQTGEKDFLFEESAQYSEVLEKLMSLDENDCNRVSKLIDKLIRDKSQTT